MSDVTKPRLSHTFGYWRPWNEGANLYESYMDYLRDKSLEQYGANAIGNFIQAASEEQVKAIYTLGAAIGSGMSILSDKLSYVNNELVFLNRNMDVVIEQQKMSHLLLQNIAVLLRIPDFEKERQMRIELGIKFFVNAQHDPDLYDDALEELHKAEQLRKQDYFVLHRLGMIYQYSEKHVDLDKSLDYFLRAAKYASVDTSPEAEQLANILAGNSSASLNVDNGDMNKKKEPEVDAARQITLGLLSVLGLGLSSHRNKTKQVKHAASVNSDNTDTSKNKVNVKKITIKQQAAESYEKAAFASYVLGRFDDAVNYQRLALDYQDSAHFRFQLSKYLIRQGNVTEAVEQLSQSIDAEPVLARVVFKELDLLGEPQVLELVYLKNDSINKKIGELIDYCNVHPTDSTTEIAIELSNLLHESYETKAKQLLMLTRKAQKSAEEFSEFVVLVDDLILRIQNGAYETICDSDKKALISELLSAKKESLNLLMSKHANILKKIKKDRVKIGSEYGGGLVFYIDNFSNRRLVCTRTSIGRGCWNGANHPLGAVGKTIGKGSDNTSVILVKGSNKIGFFSSSPSVKTAAKLCSQFEHQGFKDWYLPSIGELKKISEHLSKIGLDQFKNLVVWSSTEAEDGSYAYALKLGSQEELLYRKKSTRDVIAIRQC